MNTKALYLSNLKYEIANNTAQSVCQKLKEIGNVEKIKVVMSDPRSPSNELDVFTILKPLTANLPYQEEFDIFEYSDSKMNTPISLLMTGYPMMSVSDLFILRIDINVIISELVINDIVLRLLGIKKLPELIFNFTPNFHEKNVNISCDLIIKINQYTSCRYMPDEIAVDETDIVKSAVHHYYNARREYQNNGSEKLIKDMKDYIRNQKLCHGDDRVVSIMYNDIDYPSIENGMELILDSGTDGHDKYFYQKISLDNIFYNYVLSKIIYVEDNQTVVHQWNPDSLVRILDEEYLQKLKSEYEKEKNQANKNQRDESIKDKDIYEDFIMKTGIDRNLILDYRLCCNLYGVPKIQNAIVIELKNGTELIYMYKDKN